MFPPGGGRGWVVKVLAMVVAALAGVVAVGIVVGYLALRELGRYLWERDKEIDRWLKR